MGVGWIARGRDSATLTWAWGQGPACVSTEAEGRSLGWVERVGVSCGRGSHEGC